jgi:signal transduction histidine kinase/DNA-binding NarL/FixJ family response regulator
VDFEYVELVEPVMAAGQALGWIHIMANTSDLQGQLKDFARITTTVLALALLVAIVLSIRIQRAIARPIVALTQASQRIRDRNDYSIRVQERAGAELGTLQDTFNAMLNQIQRADQELQKAHDELEERVNERTKELSEEVARRKAIQDDLEQAKEAAEAANRAKTEFLANISHEIRTPLNGIIGFTDLLRTGDEGCKPEERRDYLQTIHKSGLHLLDLISDVLDLSKIEVGHLDVELIDCSPHQVVSEVVTVLRSRAQAKGLSLDYRWETGLPSVIRSDPGRLRQLLINLVSNAIKFTETGGIEIVAGMTGLGGDRLRVDVVDTGIGIPAEKLDAIFEPFTQADNSVTRRYGGTGLGLAISRRVAEALGGELLVQSEIGCGSRFSLIIDPGPLAGVTMLASPESAAHQKRELASAGCDLSGTKILVVDDGDTNRKLIQLILRRAGAHAVTVENGREAVDKGLEKPFDLILMDMQMPVMDGYTATRKLRQRGIAIPIVALTAHALKGDEEKCRDAGCSGYLTKPIEADRLLRTLAPMLCRQPSESDSTSQPPLDEDAVQAEDDQPISSTLPIDDEEFCDIVGEFVTRLDTRVGEMRTALDRADQEALTNLAHWLKGAGGTAGFACLTEPARQLEKSAREGRFEQGRGSFEEIAALAKRIEAPASAPAG